MLLFLVQFFFIKVIFFLYEVAYLSLEFQGLFMKYSSYCWLVIVTCRNSRQIAPTSVGNVYYTTNAFKQFKWRHVSLMLNHDLYKCILVDDVDEHFVVPLERKRSKDTGSKTRINSIDGGETVTGANILILIIHEKKELNHKSSDSIFDHPFISLHNKYPFAHQIFLKLCLQETCLDSIQCRMPNLEAWRGFGSSARTWRGFSWLYVSMGNIDAPMTKL